MKQMASPYRKSIVKRNLNNSFNNNVSLLSPSSIVNYSIDTSDDDSSLVIRLRKSNRQTQNQQRSIGKEEKVVISDDSNSIIFINESGGDSENGNISPMKSRELRIQNMKDPLVLLEQINIQNFLKKGCTKNNSGIKTCNISPEKSIFVINTLKEKPVSHKLQQSVTQSKPNSLAKDSTSRESKEDNMKGFTQSLFHSSPNKSVADTEKLLKEKLKICDDLSPYVSGKNLKPNVRKSSRNRKEISYKEFEYSIKTPPKRNRKLSTDSNSSAVIVTPKKKSNICSPQKSNRKSNKLSNVSPKKNQTKNSVKNEYITPKKNRKFQGGSKHSPNKIYSTPLKETGRYTSVKDRAKRSISTPIRFRNSDDDDNETSPRKKTKNGKRDIENYLSSDENGLAEDFEKISIKHTNTKNNSVMSTPNKRCQHVKKFQTPNKRMEMSENIAKNSVVLRKKVQDVNDARTPDKKDGFIKNSQTPKSAVKNTPSAKVKLIRDGVITPSVQVRATPVKKDRTPLTKARTKLHVSYIPKKLPCREKEYDNVFNFLEGKLLDGCGGCMYISGVPGTGKTATVTDVIRKLEEKSINGALRNFQFVGINGMKLSEPRQSYVEILKQLTGKTVPWEKAQSTLDTRFTRPGKKTLPIILLVDELDILCTKRQDVVYNLLDWPTKASAQLIVITIANTMDLPERLLMGRVTSRLGLTRLTFQAYTHKQLQEIVTLRLIGTKVFIPDAVQLVARKVASVSGDARRALDICRRAAEIAELENPHTLVSMSHVNEALNAMITQPKVKAIKYCSRLQQLILQSVVAEVERTGVEETTFSDVYVMFESIAAIDGFQKVSCTLALAAVSKLGACRLLLTDQKCNDFHQKLILNVSADDVYYALRKF